LVPIVSGGDIDRTTPLYGMGEVGVFVKEVQGRVVDGEADAGVHSCKDLPTSLPAALRLAALLQRADPRDALVGATSLNALPLAARIGTSSLRRMAQLAALRPDLQFVNLRGNVETRLRKVRDGEADATVLAAAGLGRLGLLRRAGAVPLDPSSECTPAAAQGAVAIDCRANDHRAQRLLAAIAHHDTTVAVGIERTVLAGLRGGCSLPLGVHVHRRDGRWELIARLARDGAPLQTVAVSGPAGTLADRCLTALA
jgi:hydroxymethylbilane synthase